MKNWDPERFDPVMGVKGQMGVCKLRLKYDEIPAQ